MTMKPFYKKYIEKEDHYYSQQELWTPRNVPIHPDNLNAAISWMARGNGHILDFGCGSGILSVLCVLRGAQSVLGIDLSNKGIDYANRCTAELSACMFRHGSVEKLQELFDSSFDGIILSNILDNMLPEDALEAFSQCVRLLRPGGKLLLKLNPYLSEKQIRDWNIQVLHNELLDDGMLLWNKENAFWQELCEKHFRKVRLEDVYYFEYDKHERLFLCVK